MNENRNKTRRSGKTSKQQKKKQSREVCEEFFCPKPFGVGCLLFLQRLSFLSVNDFFKFYYFFCSFFSSGLFF